MSRQEQGKQCIIKRRSILKLGLSIGILPVAGVAGYSAKAAATGLTPAQSEGPFYPIHQQSDKDVDLTTIQGHKKQAEGLIIIVQGSVKDPNGSLLKNAFVEIWQADSRGRYRHRKDPNPAALDPDFQGWGQTRSDERGQYSFKTIMPAAYPAGPSWMRPPHIHFNITMKNYHALTTQMYFPDNKYNASDLILQNLSNIDQQMVISKRQDKGGNETVYRFDIVLRPHS